MAPSESCLNLSECWPRRILSNAAAGAERLYLHLSQQSTPDIDHCTFYHHERLSQRRPVIYSSVTARKARETAPGSCYSKTIILRSAGCIIGLRSAPRP
ncbi:hypothetical protein BDW66DRAFT_144949 [Aspergillus desertorum]